MAEIISTVMSVSITEEQIITRVCRTKERAIFLYIVEVEDITTRVFSFTIDYVNSTSGRYSGDLLSNVMGLVFRIVCTKCVHQKNYRYSTANSLLILSK